MISETELAALIREIHEGVNAHRMRRGLAALAWSPPAAQEAREHARGMALDEVPFGHQGFEKRMENLKRVIRFRSGAENVAMEWNGKDAGSRAVRHWLASPGHANNINAASYTLSGVGGAQARDLSLYFVQLFIGSSEC